MLKKTSDTDNPVILESIGYLKTHDAKLDPNVEMRMHLSHDALVSKTIVQTIVLDQEFNYYFLKGAQSFGQAK